MRLSDTRTLGPARALAHPRHARATRPSTSCFRRYPFTLLEDGEAHSVSGLCGRIWTLTRDYPALDGPEDVRGLERAGHGARAVRPLGRAGRATARAELVSEARVAPVDGAAAMRLRALWAVVGPFERLVGCRAARVAAPRRAG